GYRPKWSPDGALILFSSSGHEGGTPRLYVVARDGGTPRPLRADVLKEISAVNVAWRPDGTGVSIRGRLDRATWTFVTVPVRDGAAIAAAMAPDVEQQIKESGLALGRFVWSRSGRYLFFEGDAQNVRNLWRITVDPDTLAWIGGPDRLTTGAGQDTDIALSPDGRRLVFSARAARTRLWTFPFDAATGRLKGDGQPVTSGGAGEQDAEAPLDGSKLVYSVVRGSRQELWERTIADGRDRLLISTGGWSRVRPRW